MGLKGYYVKPNFFTGEPEEEAVTFYLTDGGRDSGNISRIKDVFVSVDLNKMRSVINVPDAYGKSTFIAEIPLVNEYQLKRFGNFMNEIKEWLGLRNTWRKISSEGKTVTFIVIDENNVTVHVFNG